MQAKVGFTPVGELSFDPRSYMASEVTPAPDSIPHANAALAADCDQCHGWGTLITRHGRLELCPTCQADADRAHRDSHPAIRGSTRPE